MTLLYLKTVSAIYYQKPEARILLPFKTPTGYILETRKRPCTIKPETVQNVRLLSEKIHMYVLSRKCRVLMIRDHLVQTMESVITVVKVCNVLYMYHNNIFSLQY